MYCVHEPASVAGTWHSARFTVGTNLLPAVDILRAVMSRNKMARKKNGTGPCAFLSSFPFLLAPSIVDFVSSFVVGKK